MLVVTFSGMSGTGKTTLQQKLVASGMGHGVVSNTTRPQRASDVGGEYRYLSKEKFVLLDDLLWSTEIHGHLYGTRASDLETVLLKKKVAILVLNTTSVPTLAEFYCKPKGVRLLSFYLLSPGANELRRRMLARGDLPAIVASRIHNSIHWDREAKASALFTLIAPGAKDVMFIDVLAYVRKNT